MKCPNCNEECIREEVDVGTCTVYSPYKCNNCGWDEQDEIDKFILESGFKETL